MITKTLTIINKLGLHARAAAKLASTCSRFSHECDWTSSQSSSATFSTEDDDQRRGVICDTIDIEDRQRRVVTGIVMSKFLKPTNKLAGRRQRRGRKPITQEKPVTPESDVLSQNTSFLCIIETFTYQMTTTLLELYQRKLVN